MIHFHICLLKILFSLSGSATEGQIRSAPLRIRLGIRSDAAGLYSRELHELHVRRYWPAQNRSLIRVNLCSSVANYRRCREETFNWRFFCPPIIPNGGPNPPGAQNPKPPARSSQRAFCGKHRRARFPKTPKMPSTDVVHQHSMRSTPS